MVSIKATTDAIEGKRSFLVSSIEHYPLIINILNRPVMLGGTMFISGYTLHCCIKSCLVFARDRSWSSIKFTTKMPMTIR